LIASKKDKNHPIRKGAENLELKVAENVNHHFGKITPKFIYLKFLKYCLCIKASGDDR